MNTKKTYVLQDYISLGIEPDGSELFARKTKINDVEVIQYNWLKKGEFMMNLAPVYIACSTLDKLKVI